VCSFAQEFRGSLLVEVRDASAGTIPSAKVELADRGSGSSLFLSTDSLGEARFQAIAPSIYSVTVTAVGLRCTNTKSHGSDWLAADGARDSASRSGAAVC
jgi:hypothetical protein